MSYSVRWILISLLMCNGIYFLWQSYLSQNEVPIVSSRLSTSDGSGKLILLSELSNGVQDKAASHSSHESTNVDAGQDRTDICWFIGPFEEDVSGKQVVNRLAALDISSSLQAIDIAAAPDYWVYLPPQVSRKTAVNLLKQLQAKKIDSFLITEGELENGISLGFFTQQLRADKVHKQRMEQGYNALIKSVPRLHSEIWVVFAPSEQEKFSDNLWEKIQQGNKGLERRKNYCDTIAS